MVKMLPRTSYLVHGLERLLYQAGCREASGSPWSECENNGRLVRENDQTSCYYASYEEHVPENNTSNSMTVLTVNTVKPVKNKIRDFGKYGIYGDKNSTRWDVREHLTAGGERCAMDSTMMSSYEPVKNPL
jgi:hypothetical protein